MLLSFTLSLSLYLTLSGTCTSSVNETKLHHSASWASQQEAILHTSLFSAKGGGVDEDEDNLGKSPTTIIGCQRALSRRHFCHPLRKLGIKNERTLLLKRLGMGWWQKDARKKKIPPLTPKRLILLTLYGWSRKKDAAPEKVLREQWVRVLTEPQHLPAVWESNYSL